MNAKDRVSKMALRYRLAVAETVIEGGSYQDVRARLAEMGCPAAELPSDRSLNGFKNTSEFLALVKEETQRYQVERRARLAGRSLGSVATLAMTNLLGTLEWQLLHSAMEPRELVDALRAMTHFGALQVAAARERRQWGDTTGATPEVLRMLASDEQRDLGTLVPASESIALQWPMDEPGDPEAAAAWAAAREAAREGTSGGAAGAGLRVAATDTVPMASVDANAGLEQDGATGAVAAPNEVQAGGASTAAMGGEAEAAMGDLDALIAATAPVVAQAATGSAASGSQGASEDRHSMPVVAVAIAGKAEPRGGVVPVQKAVALSPSANVGEVAKAPANTPGVVESAGVPGARPAHKANGSVVVANRDWCRSPQSATSPIAGSASGIRCGGEDTFASWRNSGRPLGDSRGTWATPKHGGWRSQGLR